MKKKTIKTKFAAVFLASLLGITSIPALGTLSPYIAQPAMADTTLPGSQINAALKNLALDDEEPFPAVVQDGRIRVSSSEAEVENTGDVLSDPEAQILTENGDALDPGYATGEEGVFQEEAESIVSELPAPEEVPAFVPEEPVILPDPAEEPVILPDPVPEEIPSEQEPAPGPETQAPDVSVPEYPEGTPSVETPDPVIQDPEPSYEEPEQTVLPDEDPEWTNEPETEGFFEENTLETAEEVPEEPSTEESDTRKHEADYQTIDTYIQAIRWSDKAPGADEKVVPLSYGGKLVAWYSSSYEERARAEAEGNTGFTATDPSGNSFFVPYEYFNTIYLYYYSDAPGDFPYFHADSAHAFQNMQSLVDISGLLYIRTDSVQSMEEMFAGDSSLENIAPLCSFSATSLVNAAGMFRGCSSLRDVSVLNAETFDLKKAEMEQKRGEYLRLVKKVANVEDPDTFPTPYDTSITYESLSDSEKAYYPMPYPVWNMTSIYADGFLDGTAASVYPDWYYRYLGMDVPEREEPASEEPEVLGIFHIAVSVQGDGQAYPVDESGNFLSDFAFREGDEVCLHLEAQEGSELYYVDILENDEFLSYDALSDTDLVFRMPAGDVRAEVCFVEKEQQTEEKKGEDSPSQEETEEETEPTEEPDPVLTTAEVIFADAEGEDSLVAVTVQGKAAESKKKAVKTLKSLDYIDDSFASDAGAELFAKGGAELDSVDDELSLFSDEPEEEPVPRQADGSEIVSISAKWITEDSVDNGDASLLYVKPHGREKQEVVMQINYALAGEHNYAPGDVVITVPGRLINYRNGAEAGSFIVPYPEDPSTKGDFNWKRIGDNYVLTNTKQMSAATKGYIQFAVAELEPVSLVDMQESAPFHAYIEVTTHKGNLIGLRSNDLTCEFDTEARITNAKKSVSNVQRVSASAVPAEYRTAGETEYIKVNWYTYGYIASNTSYTLDVTDNLVNEYGGKLLEATAGNRLSATQSITSTKDGQTKYFSFSSIYPASQFEPDVEYTFHNNAVLTVTETDPAAGGDPQLVTTRSAAAQTTWSYSLPKWVNPTGHFMVTKNGNNYAPGYKTNQGVHLDRSDLHLWKSANPIDGWYGIYHSAINELNEGTDVIISYTIDSVGYIMPWTYDPVAPVTELSARMKSNYFRKAVTIKTTDTGLSLSRFGEKLVPTEDYVYTSVEFPGTPYIYDGVPQNINADGTWQSVTAGDGTFRYEADNNKAHWPDITLQIFRNHAWEDYATASWSTGNFLITMENGTTSSDRVLLLPADTENIQTIVTTSNAAVDYDMRVNVKLLATSDIQDLTDTLFAKTYTPSMYVYNGVNMTATMADSGDTIVSIDKDGYDVLYGYTTDIQVVPSKSGTVKNINYDDRQVTIQYSAKVEERSVIHDEIAYTQAIADGRLTEETAGIWYDLLPKGVTPLMDTIKLRQYYDKIVDCYTVNNYQGTGRTLLVVETTLRNKPETYKRNSITYYEDVPQITFDAIYDFESLKDFGNVIHNVIAFESGNDILGTVEDYSGEPDNPYSDNNISTERAFDNNTEKNAMNNLDPNRNTPSFVYAGCYTNINVLSASRTSLFKEVMVNNDGWWSQGIYYENPEENKRIVYTGGEYTYRIRMMSDSETVSKDLIILDSLENFYAGSGNDAIDISAPRWQGTFLYADVSQLESRGCAPVLYYSTIPNLRLEDSSDPQRADAINTNIHDTSIWTREDLFTGDLSTVKAIAIDASKAANGSDFELQPEESIAVFVHMQAPSGSEATSYTEQNGIWGESANAYNNAFLLCTSIDNATGMADSDNFVRHDYTKVGLREYSLTIEKLWKDDNDRDGIRPASITFRLYQDGIDTGQVLVLQEGETSGTFSHLPYCDPTGTKYHYTVREDAVAGYESSYQINDKTWKFTNTHDPETIVISGVKTWTGDEDALDARPSAITVSVYGDGTFVRNVTVREPWTYTIPALYRYRDGGVEIVYTIKEGASNDKWGSYIPTVDGYNIVNTYHPFGSLEITKELQQATPAAEDVLFPFTIEFTKQENNETVPVFDLFHYQILENDTLLTEGDAHSGDVIRIKGGQKIYFEELPENLYYNIEEEQQPGFLLAKSVHPSGIITANKAATASFTNKYQAKGQLELSVAKKLTNRQMRKYQFSFRITDALSGSSDPIKSASNGTVTVTEREDGTIEYSTAEGSFSALRYTQEDDGQLFVYQIAENQANKPGYEYDGTSYYLYVLPKDNGDGTMDILHWFFQEQNQQGGTIQLIDPNDPWWEDPDPTAPTPQGLEPWEETPEFINAYHASGELVLRAWKNLHGRRLEEGEFTFQLLDEEGNVLDIKSNAADGSITFDALQFDETDIGKTYRYAICEVEGDDERNVYDMSVYGYQVEVLDNGDGTLSFNQGKATPIFAEEPDYSNEPAEAPEGIRYAVSLYGIGTDTDSNGKVMGLTFGPALGANYVNSYHSHVPSGNTTHGNPHRCIHNDSWNAIIYWNEADPDVYEECIAEGCTHSVGLDFSETDTLVNEDFDASFTGDGPAMLREELCAESVYNLENLRWHPNNNRPGSSGHWGTNYNGWGASRVRAMLNGYDSLTDIGDGTGGDTYSNGGDPNKSASIYTDTNCLFATFPAELQAAIGARTTKYDSDARNVIPENLRTSYDRLWLLSPNEIWNSERLTSFYDHPLEGTQYPYFTSRANSSSSSSNFDLVAYGKYGGVSAMAWWLRSVKNDSTSTDEAGRVESNGALAYDLCGDGDSGIAPCFSLSRITQPEESAGPTVKYAISLYGIATDIDANGDPMGMTFGPALGADYTSQYHSHTPTGETTKGNEHRCLHNDDWLTIIQWNNKDPYVYEQCIAEGCTHSVDLDLSRTETLRNEDFEADCSGDGPSALYNEIAGGSLGENNLENLRWHPNTNTAMSPTGEGSTDGGWGASRIRAMLNGADALTDIGDGTGTGFTYPVVASSDINRSASIYTSQNCLLNAFPQLLQTAIGSRATKYDPIYNALSSENTQISYDKLWLLSHGEIYGADNGNSACRHPLETLDGEGEKYPYFQARTASPTTWMPASITTYWFDSSGSVIYGPNVTRSTNSGGPQYVATTMMSTRAADANNISPCFTFLAKAPLPITERDLPEIIGWETEDAPLPEFNNTLKPGDLTVQKKTVNAENANQGQKFHFKIKLLGENLEDLTESGDLSPWITMFSHTDNVDNEGVQHGDYQNGQYYTDVVTIPGATSLHVTLTYSNVRGSFYVWDGAHEEVHTRAYTAEFNVGTARKTYSYVSGKDYEFLTDEFDVPGDSLSLLFYSSAYDPNSSDWNEMTNYGYYMVIEGTS